MKKITISLGLMFCLPVFVLAQNVTYLNTAISQGKTLLGNFITLLISLAIVWFIWNVIRYTMSSDEANKEKAKSQMVWGIIAIAVIVSVWGIVALLRGAFGVESNQGAPDSINNMIPGVTQNTSGQRSSNASTDRELDDLEAGLY